MKKIFSVVLGGCLLLGACAATEQKTITIKGKVQFPDNQYNMEIVERNGFDKTNARIRPLPRRAPAGGRPRGRAAGALRGARGARRALLARRGRGAE